MKQVKWENAFKYVALGIIHYFQQEYRDLLLGEGVNPVVRFKMPVLATLPVHKTSLANKIFIAYFLVGEEVSIRVCSVCL